MQQDNTKVDHRERQLDWIYLWQSRYRWQAYVNAVITLSIIYLYGAAGQCDPWLPIVQVSESCFQTFGMQDGVFWCDQLDDVSASCKDNARWYKFGKDKHGSMP